MARPRSEDRRASLLDAATKVFAEHGVSAPTSLISKTAKVSEGSFFTYFKTKDELINALYREIRLDLASAVMNGFPRKATVRDRLEHVWARYVSWGVANPVARKALKHVSMSKAITRDRACRRGRAVRRGRAAAAGRGRAAQAAARSTGRWRLQALKALAEMTMDLIERQPEQARRLKAGGFQMLWGALTSKP